MAVPMGAGCIRFGFAKNEDPLTVPSSPKQNISLISNSQSRQRSLMTATVGHSTCAANDCAIINQSDCDLDAIKKIPKDKTLVYIFGGPGSKKGCIAENLTAAYGFNLISIEEVLINDLPVVFRSCSDTTTNVKKETESNTTTSVDGQTTTESVPSSDSILRVKRILQECPDKLSLSWMLDHLAAEIRRKVDQSPLLIDLLPNFQFMLEAECFAPSDCAEQMDKLEMQMPSIIALYLDARQQVPQVSTRYPNRCCDGGACDDDTAEIKSEFDAAKMQLRHSTFVHMVKPYVDYFRNKKRLITLDTTHASSDHVWFKVNELFENLNFKPKGLVNPTFVFAVGNHDINIQPEKSYTILRLLPQEFYSNEQHLLNDLGIETQKVEMSSKPLVVICHVANTLLMDAEHPAEEKCIKYLENEDEFTRLELTLSNHRDMKNEGNDFKAISTPGNVVCFFPRGMDDVICRQVAAHVSAVVKKNLNRPCT